MVLHNLRSVVIGCYDHCRRLQFHPRTRHCSFLIIIIILRIFVYDFCMVRDCCRFTIDRIFFLLFFSTLLRASVARFSYACYYADCVFINEKYTHRETHASSRQQATETTMRLVRLRLSVANFIFTCTSDYLSDITFFYRFSRFQ